MQSDIAFITDSHFGIGNSNKQLFEMMMEFYEKQFFPYLISNNITSVFHLGDVVNERGKIDLYILQELKQRFFKWFDQHHVHFYGLIGNHDLYYKNTMSHAFHIENLNEFEYVKYYDKPTIETIENYTFGIVPWVMDYSLFEVPKNVDIILGHFDIIGAKMNNSRESNEGLSPNIFKNIKMVLSGHYHSISKLHNIQYLGSPYQLTWNDFNENKGFWILDDSYSFTFHENVVCPKFVKIVYSENKIEVSGE